MKDEKVRARGTACMPVRVKGIATFGELFDSAYRIYAEVFNSALLHEYHAVF
jgi:hypothetical protein